jgi:hypothetical protein
LSRFYEVSNTEIINLNEITFIEFTDQVPVDDPNVKKVKIGFRGSGAPWWFYLTAQERTKLRQVLTERNRIC